MLANDWMRVHLHLQPNGLECVYRIYFRVEQRSNEKEERNIRQKKDRKNGAEITRS